MKILWLKRDETLLAVLILFLLGAISIRASGILQQVSPPPMPHCAKCQEIGK